MPSTRHPMPVHAKRARETGNALAAIRQCLPSGRLMLARPAKHCPPGRPRPAARSGVAAGLYGIEPVPCPDGTERLAIASPIHVHRVLTGAMRSLCIACWNGPHARSLRRHAFAGPGRQPSYASEASGASRTDASRAAVVARRSRPGGALERQPHPFESLSHRRLTRRCGRQVIPTRRHARTPTAPLRKPLAPTPHARAAVVARRSRPGGALDRQRAPSKASPTNASLAAVVARRSQPGSASNANRAPSKASRTNAARAALVPRHVGSRASMRLFRATHAGSQSQRFWPLG